MRRIIALPAEGETAFRLFRESRGLDLHSDHARGRPPRHAQVGNALIHMGLSFWQTEAAALAKNQDFGGKLGDRLAVLELSVGLGIWYAETFSIEHFTVWGRAENLEICVRETRAI